MSKKIKDFEKLEKEMIVLVDEYGAPPSISDEIKEFLDSNLHFLIQIINQNQEE